MAAKALRKEDAARAKFSGKCLMILRRHAGVRNISCADGGLTGLLLLAIVARGAPLVAGKRALSAIRESFVDWNELRVTRVGQIVAYLVDINHATEKARTIRDVLLNIFEGTHDIGLGFLEGASAEEARDFLTGLGGLSEEMVTEVILSGRAFFTMTADGEVARAARRLGLAGRNTSPGSFQRDVAGLLGEERAYQLMFLLKELSEHTCTIWGPSCGECPLGKICPGSRAK